MKPMETSPHQNHPRPTVKQGGTVRLLIQTVFEDKYVNQISDYTPHCKPSLFQGTVYSSHLRTQLHQLMEPLGAYQALGF